jgi:carbohydrate kinase (thermoresistant glucokinase family)
MLLLPRELIFHCGRINGKSRARDQAPARREHMLCRGVGVSRRAACAREGGRKLQTKTASPLPDPSVLVVMGVSGCGKSTIAMMLAHRLNWIFEEGDWFHPPSNVEKMHSGVPLTDEDRWPWLHGIAAWIDATRRVGNHGTVACSALKRAYRDILLGERPDVRLVYLKGDRDLIARRLAARDAHFMPPSLLDSQFASLEEPQPDEHTIVVSIVPHPREIVEEIVKRLGKAAAPSAPGIAATARRSFPEESGNVP